MTESYRQIRLWFSGMHRCDRLWVPWYPSWMVIWKIMKQSWISPCEKTTRTLQQMPANDYILRDAIGRVTPGWSAISSKCVRNLKCRHGTFRVVWGLCRDWIEMMEIKDAKILGGLKVSLPNTLASKKTLPEKYGVVATAILVMQVSPIWKWTISMAFWKPCRKVYVVSKMGGHPKCQGIIATFHSSKDTLWIYDAVLLWKSLHFFSRKDSIYLNNPWINRFRKWWYIIYVPKCISPCVASHCTDRPETKPLRTSISGHQIPWLLTQLPTLQRCKFIWIKCHSTMVQWIASRWVLKVHYRPIWMLKWLNQPGRGKVACEPVNLCGVPICVYSTNVYDMYIHIFFNVTPCWVSWLSKKWDKSLWCFSYDLL